MAGPPTVLVQADNSWRTLAAAVAVGLRGGLIAVISGHATRSEYELALEDIEPDAVLALTRRRWPPGRWTTRRCPPPVRCSRAGRSVRPPGTDQREWSAGTAASSSP